MSATSPQLNATHFDVCIIGAGIAGLSAAQILCAKGLNVAVLEKSRGPGGRMATRRIDGAQFNHGAPSFTLESDEFIAWARADARKDSLKISEIRASSRHYKATTTAGSSMNLLARSIFTPPNFYTLIRVTALAHTPAQAWQVQYQRETAASDVLETGALTADKLVLALPAPQAAALLKPLAPPFNHIGQLAASVDYDPCWVAMFTLANPSGIATNEFGEATIPDGISLSKCILQISANHGSQESWVAYGTTAWTNSHLNEAKEVAGNALFTAFTKHFQCAQRPTELVSHRWLYSQPAAHSNVVMSDWLGSELGLFCIGDWVHIASATNTLSRIERAWASGQLLEGYF